MNAVDYTDPEEEPTVYLPVLDVIRLRENAPVTGASLQTLQIPASTCLDFEIVEDLSWAESMLEDIGNHLRRADSPAFRSMSLSRGNRHRTCTVELHTTINAPRRQHTVLPWRNYTFISTENATDASVLSGTNSSLTFSRVTAATYQAR